jgi:hypothetical protein
MTAVEIRIPPETQSKIAKLAALPDEIPKAIKRGMDYSLSIVRGRIQNQRLGGKGPYPPAEHRLGIVTQQLQRSLREEPAVITGGNTVTGSIGSPVFYGALHEYGWTGTVVRGQGKPYVMKIPERAPVRTGVTENADFIQSSIVDEIDKSLADTAKA